MRQRVMSAATDTSQGTASPASTSTSAQMLAQQVATSQGLAQHLLPVVRMVPKATWQAQQAAKLELIPVVSRVVRLADSSQQLSKWQMAGRPVDRLTERCCTG